MGTLIVNPYLSGDPYWGNVVLLLKGEGLNGSSNIVDSSNYSRLITPIGTASISTSVKKHGTSSIYCAGGLNYLRVDSSPDLLPTGAYTVECYIYHLSQTSSEYGQAIIGMRSSGETLYNFGITHYFGYYSVAIGDTGSGLVGTVKLNTWTHLALSANGSQALFFVDGILTSTFNYTPTTSPSILTICNEPAPDSKRGSQAYIDDLRITQGIQRYTSSFTPSKYT